MQIKYKKINSLSAIESHIPCSATEKDDLLVVLDMDLTLTMPKLPVLIYLVEPNYRIKLRQWLAPLTPEKQRKVMTMGLQIQQQKLVEQEAPAIIKKIKEQHIKSIILTASFAGQFNNSTPLELQRFEKLKELGIHLINELFPNKLDLGTAVHYKGAHAIYYKGILCAYGEPGKNIKGPALINFLDKVQFWPKSVIMVDDKKKNLDDVCHTLHTLDPSLKFIGLEYQGTNQHLPKSIDEKAFQAYWQQLIEQVR